MPKIGRRVVIAGAGFAGLSAARAIRGSYEVTLVDPQPDFEFIPNIHEIVSGLKTPDMVRLSRPRLAKHMRHTFHQDAVASVDPKARLVITGRGARLPYDALILAPGGTARGKDVPGVAEHALLFKSADDARNIRRRLDVLRGLDKVGYVTICGGGVTGTELLGEILRRYRKDKNVVLRVVESKERLMDGWPSRISRRVTKLAEDHRVMLTMQRRVTAVGPASITLDDGQTYPSDVTIWVTGETSPDFVQKSQIPLGPNGWGHVNSALQSTIHPEIFIAGDAADVPKGVKKQAAQALRLGERAGKNVKRYLSRRPLKEFRRQKAPLLITFGDLTTFLIMPDEKTVIETPALAIGREVVFQKSMAELDDLGERKSSGRLIRRMETSLLRLPWADPMRVPMELVSGLFDLRIFS